MDNTTLKILKESLTEFLEIPNRLDELEERIKKLEDYSREWTMI